MVLEVKLIVKILEQYRYQLQQDVREAKDIFLKGEVSELCLGHQEIHLDSTWNLRI